LAFFVKQELFLKKKKTALISIVSNCLICKSKDMFSSNTNPKVLLYHFKPESDAETLEEVKHNLRRKFLSGTF